MGIDAPVLQTRLLEAVPCLVEEQSVLLLVHFQLLLRLVLQLLLVLLPHCPPVRRELLGLDRVRSVLDLGQVLGH